MTKLILFYHSAAFKLWLFFLFLLALILFLKPLISSYYPDFSSYYYGARTVLHGGNPYLGGKNFFGPFLYPPSALLFFLPFTFFPFFLAEKIFTVFSLLCFFSALFLLFKLCKLPFYSRTGLVLTTLALLYFPEKFTLGMGQVNNVIFLLLVCFVYWYTQKKQTRAGMFLALTISLKLFPLLLLLYILIDKRWKTFAATIVTLLLIGTFTYICINHTVIAYFFTTALPKLFNSLADAYYNQSLSGFLLRTAHNPSLTTRLRLIIEGILVLFSFAIMVIRRGTKACAPRLLCISMLLILNLMLDAIAWQHHFVWMLIPLVITFFYIKNNKLDYKYYLILAVSYLLMAANIRNPASVPIFFQSHGFYGAIVLYCLNLYLILKILPVDNKNKEIHS